jgi:hypothetical protein
MIKTPVKVKHVYVTTFKSQKEDAYGKSPTPETH